MSRFPPLAATLVLSLGLGVYAASTLAAADAQSPSSGEASSNPDSFSAAHIEFFEKQIRPIFVEHCYECHAGGESDGGLVLDSREAMTRGGDTGRVIVPGQPNASLLIEAVRYDNHDLQMPPQNPLSPSQIAALEKWVSLGAPDPRKTNPSTELGGAVAPTGMSLEEGRKFWSIQPIERPELPTSQHESWGVSPIDAFVLAKLGENGLRPAPPADRRTLIRRVTQDLTGLPPTIDEINAFINDQRPNAYELLVERLLASPQYGVRWGRHWLDVARYADSNGLDENLAFGNAWRYRDYVIESFNDDTPFDQFLVEQLAGDLMPNANQETKTATGFLVLGAKVLAEPDREKLEMDTIDEQLDSMGKAFLGMTFGCVRCHDHKFDPIKQTDYYALAAIFKSTRTFADSNTGAIKHWNEHDFATDEEREAIKAVDAEIAKRKAAASSFKRQATAELRKTAESLATEYLVAAMQVDLEMSLSQIEHIAQPLGLHPRVLHSCRRHLHFHREDPFLQPWHKWAQSDNAAAVDEHYRPLFKKAAAKATDDDDQAVKLARAALRNKSGFLTIPAKPEFAFDEEVLAEYGRLMEKARLFESAAPDTTSAMGVTDGEITESLPIHIRGSHLNLGEKIPRGFPEVMQTFDDATFTADQSGRLELANWMASEDHPLTARVYVNRIWRWHFGRGIVKSTDNFGALGDRPSHPELLDWLADEFMSQGWSTKELHRMILRSSTYRMSSIHPEAARYQSIDPENRLRWRFDLQRLEAEQVRDSILAVADRLETTLGGKMVPLRNRQFVFNHTSVDHTKYDSLRRAAYLPVIRNNLYTVLEQFNFPDPTMPTGDRHSTVVAPQALLLMNSDWVMESADKIAKSLLNKSASESSLVEAAYLRVLGRPPTQEETEQALTFLDQSPSDFDENDASADDRVRRWSLLCHGLLASNEFMYVN